MSTPKIDDQDTVFYRPGVNYEITLNAPDKSQFFNKLTRVNKVVEFYSAVTELFRPIGQFELYPELSEIRNSNPEKQRQSRWHYHGVIRFTDELAVAEFLLTISYKLSKLVDYQINTYRKEYWNTYIQKQQFIMKPLCKSKNVPYVLTSTKPQFTSTL